MERAHTCCFTGSRPEHLGFDVHDDLLLQTIRRDLRAVIRRAAENGFTDFLCGMSRGFDLLAAEAVLALQDELELHLHAAIPFPEQTEGWPDEEIERYAKVLSRCTSSFTLSSTYTPGAYHARNRFMVDNSALVIAWDTGRKTGGTHHTCSYARKRNVQIHNLADPQLSFFSP